MSADRNSLLGSPLVLTGMLALVLAGAWRTREWFRDTHPDQVLRSESAEWHEAYDRWVDLGSDAWPGVLDALQGDSGPARRMALLAVASLRDAPSEVRDEVRQLLSAPDPADRREALVAWTGADRDPLHALDELATACGDENSIVRGTALELIWPEVCGRTNSSTPTSAAMPWHCWSVPARRLWRNWNKGSQPGNRQSSRSRCGAFVRWVLRRGVWRKHCWL